MSDQPPDRIRLRVRFGKHGPLRYTSHLDLARIWERLLRRAGLNLVYSQGFNPRPKIQLAAALPLGYTSRTEILDIWLAQRDAPDLDSLLVRLREVAPEGLEVDHVEQVDERGPALQTLTRGATYEITLPDEGDPALLHEAVSALLAADTIPRERRGKAYDLRPLIHNLEVDDASDQSGVLLTLTMALGEGGTGRPDEVLVALELDPNQAHIERTSIAFADPLPD